MNATADRHAQKIVYWHRDLPPLDAEVVDGHTLEATSSRVTGTLTRPDDIWDRCHRELMAAAEARLGQEVARLGGDFAHVCEEVVTPRHDDTTGQGWLHGRFGYTMYRRLRVRQ